MYLSHIRKDQREKLNRKIKVKYPRPLGTVDIIPQNNTYVYKTKIREAAYYVGMQTGNYMISTPNIEPMHLYKKFFDKHPFMENLVYLNGYKDNPIILKPDMTISIARAHIENGLHLDREPRQYWYYEKLYHMKNKQFREFYRFGIDVYRESNPAADANLIYLMSHFFNILGLQNKYTIHINNIGNKETQQKWAKEISLYFKDKLKKLPQEVKKIIDCDPMQLLNFDDEDVKLHLLNGPKLIDFVDSKSLKHYNSILDYLKFIEIELKEDPIYLPQMPYYENVVFGIKTSFDSKKSTEIATGGRYTNIVEILGGEPVEALGMYVDTDVLESVLIDFQIDLSVSPKTEIFIAHLGQNAHKYAFKLVKKFREMGIAVKESLGNGTLRQQIKEANRLKALYMILIGEKELENGEVIIKNLELDDQQIVPLDQIFNIVLNYIDKKNIKKFELK